MAVYCFMLSFLSIVLKSTDTAVTEFYLNMITDEKEHMKFCDR